MYEYSARTARVVDGDTVYLTVDLGFNIQTTLDFRLNGINAPETRGETHDAGVAAREYLRSLIEGKQLLIRTSKPDKYGRWLVTITVDGKNVNDDMVATGHAVEYHP